MHAWICIFTDQSSRRPAPPRCAPSGEPTRCCTWSRSGWRVWPCSISWPACSWQCRPPPVPSKTRAAALGGPRGRFPAARWGRWSHRQLWREGWRRDWARDGQRRRWKEWEEPERMRKGEKRWGWEGKQSRQETAGQCIITTVFAWDYPFAQYTVKSLSFDIVECLHKGILESRKFWIPLRQ